MENFIGPRRPTIIIQIPFPGFYDSSLSSALDSEEERAAENEVERQNEDTPKELHLDDSRFAEIFYDCTDYSAAHLTLAHDYLEQFNYLASEAMVMELGLTFESMISPREYNFGTDRLFAYIPDDAVKMLFAKSMVTDHKALRKLVAERFTSRSGFISGYSNETDEWLEEDVLEWDHNKLCALLEAVLSTTGEDIEQQTVETIWESEAAYQAWEGAVDWPKFEELVAEARAKMEDELHEDDPDYVPSPVRCPLTPDLFQGSYAG